ncbi:MAG TPA: UDP-N-acetylmuramoyl-L-alanine--D-glutamate ligase [Bosea sp. (in: a-proteobacteria)]|jgi:UDP-N-acetylmuramoylalanine--D-glutamate ligase|uniref:UDP-N-acetylmuramoyl-L-alanine--D-glutamate ligase n=1 Tax=Bosea sp. (in: a-proteobacteria) TaxID=1871050 RepID=UPI002E161DEA|nr:UDP-N-acetylmuramoyl-L-alanine--D-glutamate ligase [Bosea sp. (in: a-proteobacteria)]
MTPVTAFSGRKVALFGLGGSGLVTARALAAGGAEVSAWDDSPASRDKAAAEGIAVVDLASVDWAAFHSLILAPGVPLTHPVPHWTVDKARAAGIEVIGDVELFFRERGKIAPGAPVVCITGTNGKSTTTALIAHVLRSAGRDVQMGGNIGTAVLALEPPAEGRVHVVECSSYQIDLALSMAPTIGIQMNLTPDHLDRHGSFENYGAIKERLVAGSDIAIVGVDDEPSKQMARRRAASGLPLVRISGEQPLDDGVFAGVTANGGALETRIVQVLDGKPRIVANLAGIGSLRGSHNAQNAAAAFAACFALGLSADEIAAGFKSYPGLAHRMEEIGRIGQVVFINDSKATNADSTEKALTSFRDIFWILGGKAKDGGIESLRRYFPNIAKAYLIGAASDLFAATFDDDGRVTYERSGTLDAAVAHATRDAQAHGGSGEIAVLLSPACASFDQFPNFEVRGDAFRALVKALPGFEPFGVK